MKKLRLFDPYKLGDLIAFGRPFINNPDLVERFVNGWPLSKELDTNSFYSPGEEGYTDYPVYVSQEMETQCTSK